MKQTSFWENSRKIANSLTAVAAGMLTDILFDILAEEHFEGTFTNGVIELFSISEYCFWEKCGFVLGIFLILWALLACGIPVIVYVISSWIPVKKTKISTDVVLSTYKNCRVELYSLEERAAQGNISETDCYLLFTDICQLIVQLYNIFCSGKIENIPSVKDAFRTGAMIYDIGDKISSYEYLKIIDTLNSLFESTHKIIKHCNSNLQVSDYEEIKLFLDELSRLIVDLGIEC